MFPKQNEMKSQSNNIRPFGKLTDMWKLNNTFLNNRGFKQEITVEITKYYEINENGNTIPQDLGDAMKEGLRNL